MTEEKPVERYRIALDLMKRDSRRTLDVGCSVCELEKFVPAIGIDNSRKALIQAKRANRNLELINSSSEMLPFKNSTFDSVILLETLEHVRDDQQTIREIRRVLEKEGVLIISVPNDKLLYKIIDLEYWLVPILTGRPVHRHYGREELRRLLERNELQVEHSFERGMLLAALLRWVIFPFDLIDFFLLKKIMGPIGRSLRRLLNPAIDREFSMETSHGASLFLRARKT